MRTLQCQYPDPAFDFLREKVLPKHPQGRSFDVWSAASSTGEEIYTIAMVLADHFGPDGAWSGGVGVPPLPPPPSPPPPPHAARRPIPRKRANERGGSVRIIQA